jgi:RNA polymerase sigma-70 factor (sigma-E family)
MLTNASLGRRLRGRPPVSGTAPASGIATDEDLVCELYRAHAVGLVRLAAILLGDQPSAQDVVQEAFFRLYRTLPRLRDSSKALPYVRTAVINEARSALRARKRSPWNRVAHEPSDDCELVRSAEAEAIAGEDRRELLAAVARLPRRAREVLALRYYLDLPDNEIAAILGISRGTVSSTAYRALATLARGLKEEQ